MRRWKYVKAQNVSFARRVGKHGECRFSYRRAGVGWLYTACWDGEAGFCDDKWAIRIWWLVRRARRTLSSLDQPPGCERRPRREVERTLSNLVGPPGSTIRQNNRLVRLGLGSQDLSRPDVATNCPTRTGRSSPLGKCCAVERPAVTSALPVPSGTGGVVAGWC